MGHRSLVGSPPVIFLRQDPPSHDGVFALGLYGIKVVAGRDGANEPG
jgi:hypothetical protein